MTTKRKPTKKSSPTQARSKSAGERAVRMPQTTPESAPDDSIADLAHRLFLDRGGAHGHDVDDWLEAERRLRGEDA
jgi:hypothetical protein